jgi:glutathione synthase/RimK-type ligase-like ATP-grasp enzyme
LPTGGRINFVQDPGGCEAHVIADCDRVDAGSVSAVWWRRPHYPEPDRSITDFVAHGFAAQEWRQAAFGFFSLLQARWVNHPAKDEAAHYKLSQLNAAHEVGLVVPRTLVTNDPVRARSFANDCSRVIFKAFTSHASAWRETRLLKTEHLEAIETLRLAPVIFQEFVPAAHDLRVTVVGRQVFACAIQIEQGDYEFDYRVGLSRARIVRADLPQDARCRLLALMDRLGLSFGAIDLRQKPDGSCVFLEINPAGEWLFLRPENSAEITWAVADLLTGSSGGNEST